MSTNLPRWVINLVIAMEESEELHPTYYGDFAMGMQRVQCPESKFLELVPEDVRRDALTVMHYRERSA